jgi:hypothetical protein
MGNYRYRDHNAEFGGNLGAIKNYPKVYLEWKKKVRLIF